MLSFALFVHVLFVHIFTIRLADDIIQSSEARMRKAAGIILIIYGAVPLCISVPVILTHLHLPSEPGFVFDIFFPISNAFIVTGGVFCLKRKYWKLCFASALLAVLMMIFYFWSFWGFPPGDLDWSLWYSIIAWDLPIITGALPIIFVCIRKREWQKIPNSWSGTLV